MVNFKSSQKKTEKVALGKNKGRPKKRKTRAEQGRVKKSALGKKKGAKKKKNARATPFFFDPKKVRP